MLLSLLTLAEGTLGRRCLVEAGAGAEEMGLGLPLSCTLAHRSHLSSFSLLLPMSSQFRQKRIRTWWIKNICWPHFSFLLTEAMLVRYGRSTPILQRGHCSSRPHSWSVSEQRLGSGSQGILRWAGAYQSSSPVFPDASHVSPVTIIYLIHSTKSPPLFV